MNFTLLIVTLVLAQATGCVVKEVEEEKRLRCMNGTTTYGYLGYTAPDAEAFHKIKIYILQAFPGYPEIEVTSALLKYFIKKIAKPNGFKQIILSVDWGRASKLEFVNRSLFTNDQYNHIVNL
ncbi:hypothetical protein DdX_20312 [Ditylenchus destructor]|uniref:Secreted protein n=1 Tax=Ditylenchus destructor TaxID=166010 RepID=A0AAD4QWA7_9BILA|nr:hypothetical protein DdX_20312 [Ditylenchus destructor]